MFPITETLLNKNNNKLRNFYNINLYSNSNYRNIGDANDLRVFSYNIHFWTNINDNISVEDNYENVRNLIQTINPDLIIFQEYSNIYNIDIESDFEKEGYKYKAFVQNGNEIKDNTTRYYDKNYIAIFSKFPIKNAIEVQATLHLHIRNFIVFDIDNLKNGTIERMAAVHLEIGDRFHKIRSEEKREKTKRNNTKIRKKQVNLLFKYDVDYIIGDFNFTPKDPETQYLKRNSYFLKTPINGFINTTPFNCTDMLFSSEERNNVKLYNIRTNYSDHLPIFFNIK